MPSAAPDPALVERLRHDLTALGAGQGALAVAVSGGADSLALLLLADAACKGRVVVVTVDHGLRTAATREAAFVAQLCADRDIPHTTLRVRVAAGGQGMQAAARAARYDALAGWCRAANFGLLATAHHADDQAETLLMRLSRGAGLSGLSGIRAVRPLDERVTLIRPLLGWRRATLSTVVADAGIESVDDPSNADPRYDRTRARALLDDVKWLDPARIAASAGHLAEAEAALEWATAAAYDRHVAVDGAGWRVDAAGLPPDLLRRVMLRLFAAAAVPLPRGPALIHFIATLRAGGTATLSGLAGRGGAVWRIAQEPPRRAAGTTDSIAINPAMPILSGQAIPPMSGRA